RHHGRRGHRGHRAVFRPALGVRAGGRRHRERSTGGALPEEQREQRGIDGVPQGVARVAARIAEAKDPGWPRQAASGSIGSARALEMTRRRRPSMLGYSSLLFAATWLVPVTQASADSPDEIAKDQFRQGREAFKRGDYKAALPLFRNSQQMFPQVGTLLN